MAQPRIFECVPNVSEGRDPATIDACVRAIAGSGATLAHRTSDPVHHRSVFTFFGSDETIAGAIIALARVTTQRIDLRAHRGAHPRIGALDVLPIVPFGSATAADATLLAHRIARAMWSELRVPSVFYGDAAAAGAPRTLPGVRAGGFEALVARGDRARLDVGDRAHASAGAIAIGVRTPLVAFNVVLATDDLRLATSIAHAIRERDGGLRAVRSLGIALGPGRVQVSCNLTDVAATPMHRVLALVRILAARAGVAVLRTELIGLVPRTALLDVAAHALGIEVPPSAIP